MKKRELTLEELRRAGKHHPHAAMWVYEQRMKRKRAEQQQREQEQNGLPESKKNVSEAFTVPEAPKPERNAYPEPEEKIYTDVDEALRAGIIIVNQLEDDRTESER